MRGAALRAAARRRAPLLALLLAPPALGLVLLIQLAHARPAGAQDPRAAPPRDIPPRPERLRFPERRFEPPDPGGLRHLLPNGVPVWLVEDHALPLVDLTVVVRAGDFLDPPEGVGLSSLTAAMMRRGGAGPWSAADFDRRADALGVEVDATSGATRAGASLDCLSRVLPEALDLLFALLREPRFEAGRLETIRSNLRESMARRNDHPLDVLSREWGWLLFGRDHFAARELTPESLAALGREDLQAFHRAWWRPENMILAAAGDFATEELLRQLATRFEGWVAGGPEVPWPPSAGEHVPDPGLYALENGIPQAKIALGHRAIRRVDWEDPEALALEVASELLGGGGAVSRLRSRLRAEEALVYRAGARYTAGWYGPGDFQVFLEAETASVPSVIAAAVEEIERLRREAVPVAELELAKGTLSDAFPLLFATPEAVAGRFAEDEYLGRPHSYWQSYRERVAAIGPAEVRRAAVRHLHPERLVVLVVGRWREIAAAQRLVGMLRRTVRGPFVELPLRDPTTLEPIASRD